MSRQCGFPKVIYNDVQARTEKASWTSEATILTLTPNSQAVVPSLTLDDSASPNAKMYKYEAWGTMATTGTPTFQWIVRLGTTAAYDITGTIIGATAAATTTSGVTAGTLWHLELNFGVSAFGQGTNGLTLISFGRVCSGGLAVPVQGMTITAHPTETWTAASWNSLLTYYISLSAACSASSSSNTLQVMAQRLTDLQY